MKKDKMPTIIGQAIRLSAKLYLMFVLICGGLAYLLYWQDMSRDPPDPVYWFYPAFTLGLPIVVTFMVLFIFVRDTKYRANEPYRFARRQYR